MLEYVIASFFIGLFTGVILDTDMTYTPKEKAVRTYQEHTAKH